MLGRLARDPDWPVMLREDAHGVPPHGVLVLRPLTRRDEKDWTRLRAANVAWLAPWEATDPALDVTAPQDEPPAEQAHPSPVEQGRSNHPSSVEQGRQARVETPPPGTRPGLRPIPAVSFRAYVAGLRAAAREGTTIPFAIEHDGELVGQLMVSNIVHGAQRSGVIGYWVSEHVAGRGIAPAAVAMTVDHCFDTLLMHRLELCIRPENTASLRVAAKLGLRSEGLRPRYIHIAGRWRDHEVFAVTAEEVPQPGGMLERLRRITPV